MTSTNRRREVVLDFEQVMDRYMAARATLDVPRKKESAERGGLVSSTPDIRRSPESAKKSFVPIRPESSPAVWVLAYVSLHASL